MRTKIAACLLFTAGCSMQNGNWNPKDWETISPSVSAAAEFATRTALQNNQIKPHGAVICAAMHTVSNILSDFDDPNATFESVRNAAIKAIENSMIPGSARDAAIVVVDQMLNITFMYVRDKYEGLLEQDPTRVVIVVSKAIALGATNACRDFNLSSFEFNR